MDQSKSNAGHLLTVCTQGLAERYPGQAQVQASCRLNYELEVIALLNRVKEFLVAAEIGQLTQAERIPYRLAGAACGSIIAHLLGLSDVDPLQHGLFFERFRDPEQRWAPEFLIYLRPDQSERVVQTMERTYGREVIETSFRFLEITAEEMIPGVVRDILKSRGENLCLATLPQRDEKAWRMIQVGDVDGVFELDAEENREFLVQAGPRSLPDLAAAMALVPVGLGQAELLDRYLRNTGDRQWQAFPVMADILEILEDTRGLILYQEQVMSLLRWFGDISPGDGYALIRAIRRRDGDFAEQYRICFCEAAKGYGLDVPTAEALFDEIEAAAHYVVCKSHFIANAWLSYQAAYLKAHRPREFNEAMQRLLATR